jgi:hypothetical protein
MRRGGCDGCFTMRAADANIEGSIADTLQYVATFNHVVPFLLVIQQFGMVSRNRRRIHHQGYLFWNKVHIFCIMNGNAFAFQLFGE